VESLRLVKWYAQEHVLLFLALAFLYSGPPINILAIVLTARVLGLEMADRLCLARSCGGDLFRQALRSAVPLM